MPMLAMLIWGVGAFLLRLPFSAPIAAGFVSIVSILRGARRHALNSAFARKLGRPDRPGQPAGTLEKGAGQRSGRQAATSSVEAVSTARLATAPSVSGGALARLATSGKRTLQTPLAGRPKPSQ